MEEAARNRLTQERQHQPPRQIGQVVAGSLQRIDVRNLDAVDPFQRHHRAAGAVPVDGGDAVAGVAIHRAGQFRRACGLAAQVELAHCPALEVGDGQLRTQPRRLAAQRFQMRGGPFIGFDIAREILAHAGAQHLDRDIAALDRGPAMHLRDRGGAHRHRIDMRKELLQRAAQPLLDLGADVLERHRRQAVLQFQQIDRGLIADQIGAGGERLAELDRRRTDRAKGAGVIGHLGNAGAQPRDAEQAADLGRGLRRGLQTFERSMPRKDAAPCQEPQDMRTRGCHCADAPTPRDVLAHHAFHPLWIATAPPRIGSTLVDTNPASLIICSNTGGLGKRRIDSAR